MNLPRELYLEIGSYLDKSELEAFNKGLFLGLNKKDYLFLFLNRFPFYYDEGLTRLPVGNIYTQLITLDEHILTIKRKYTKKSGIDYDTLIKSIKNNEIDNRKECKYIFAKGALIGMQCGKPVLFAGYCWSCIGKLVVKENLYKFGLTDDYIECIRQLRHLPIYNVLDINRIKKLALDYNLTLLGDYIEYLIVIKKMKLYL